VLTSVVRAHRMDFGKSAEEVLRPKDRMLLEMSKTVQKDESVSLRFYDAAFADFPVHVTQNNSVFVMEY